MVKRMAVKNNPKREKGVPRLNLSLPNNVIRVLIGITLSVCVAIGLYWLSKAPSVTSSLWPIKIVSFAGETKRVKKTQLVDMLELHNKSMLSVDLHKLRESVLGNPWIKSVEVRKQWPDTLIFMLAEKQPLAILNNGYLLANGSLIETGILQQDRQELLAIKVAQLVSVKLNRENENYAGLGISDKEQLISIAELFQSVKQLLLEHDFLVREIEIDITNSWNIKTASDFKIKVGRKNQIQRLQRFLQVYVAIENKNQLNSVDLRYRNGLAVELTSNTTSEES